MNIVIVVFRLLWVCCLFWKSVFLSLTLPSFEYSIWNLIKWSLLYFRECPIQAINHQCHSITSWWIFSMFLSFLVCLLCFSHNLHRMGVLVLRKNGSFYWPSRRTMPVVDKDPIIYVIDSSHHMCRAGGIPYIISCMVAIINTLLMDCGSFFLQPGLLYFVFWWVLQLPINPAFRSCVNFLLSSCHHTLAVECMKLWSI